MRDCSIYFVQLKSVIRIGCRNISPKFSIRSIGKGLRVLGLESRLDIRGVTLDSQPINLKLFTKVQLESRHILGGLE